MANAPKTNIIGIEKEKAVELAEELNQLLANFQLYYQNLRALHWNIRGRSFFVLHVKFEELYLTAHDKVDVLAERILTLGSTPFHSFSKYLEVGEIPEGKDISDGDQAVRLVIDSIGVLLKHERKALTTAGKLDDEGTSALLSDLISEQEKIIWMLTAYLNE